VPHVTVLGMTFGGAAEMWRQDAVKKVLAQVRLVGQVWRGLAHHVPTSKASGLLFTYVLPVALYGCQLSTVKLDPQTGKSLDAVASDFARVVLSAPFHVSKMAMLEFFGWLRPLVRGDYLRVKFAFGLVHTKMPLVRRSLHLQIGLGLPWWSETLGIAAKWGCRELLEGALRRPPLPAGADKEAIKARAELEAADTEQLWWAVRTAERQAWSEAFEGRVPMELINFPSTGSYAVKKATVPQAATLFFLRYDMNEHVRRRAGLNGMDHRCSCCSQDVMESNVHVLEDCRADLLDIAERNEFEAARAALLVHREGAVFEGERTMQMYLLWLTGPELKVRDESNTEARHLRVSEINAIVEAAACLRSTRYAAFLQRRHKGCVERMANVSAPPPMTPQQDDREAVATRILQCRDSGELDDVMRWTGYKRDENDSRYSAMRSDEWAPIFSARGMTFQLLVKVLKEVDWQMPYLLMAFPEDQNEFAREQRLHETETATESTLRSRRRKRMITNEGHAKPLLWVGRLPFEFMVGGPLVEAWFAAADETERRQLVRPWPSVIVRGTKCDQVFNPLMTALAAALAAGELQVTVNETKGDKQYADRNTDGQRRLRLWMLRDWRAKRARIAAVRIRRLDGSVLEPRREVWQRVAAQVAAGTRDERMNVVFAWRDELMLALREVERDSRPTVRFRAV
jgi:hypothetical protein